MAVVTFSLVEETFLASEMWKSSVELTTPPSEHGTTSSWGRILEAGGKPSTWFTPEGLVE